MVRYEVEERLPDDEVIITSLKSAEYQPGTKCSVNGCEHEADYEVVFYDYYERPHSVYVQTDYTCNFLCEAHMKANEAGMKGVRAPRARNLYPYTKRYGGQGYTKYIPVRNEG